MKINKIIFLMLIGLWGKGYAAQPPIEIIGYKDYMITLKEQKRFYEERKHDRTTRRAAFKKHIAKKAFKRETYEALPDKTKALALQHKL